jgi:hypothetical protein
MMGDPPSASPLSLAIASTGIRAATFRLMALLVAIAFRVMSGSRDKKSKIGADSDDDDLDGWNGCVWAG